MPQAARAFGGLVASARRISARSCSRQSSTLRRMASSAAFPVSRKVALAAPRLSASRPSAPSWSG